MHRYIGRYRRSDQQSSATSFGVCSFPVANGAWYFARNGVYAVVPEKPASVTA